MKPPSANPIRDARVNAVLDRLHGRAERQFPAVAAHFVRNGLAAMLKLPGALEVNLDFYRDKVIPISREQGWFIYLLCRGLGARRVVEFGTSFGVSTLYLAAALRDNGGGVVIGTELEPSKAAAARANFEAAGLSDQIDLREGDALETLKDCGGPVDFLLVDGWVALARPIIELMAPQLRPGAFVLCDNVGHYPSGFADYLAFVRGAGNGFASSLLPLREGVELSVRL